VRRVTCVRFPAGPLMTPVPAHSRGLVRGASLKDPSRLFNASLEGNARRAIDLHEGEKIDEEALKALVRAAIALNRHPGTHVRVGVR